MSTSHLLIDGFVLRFPRTGIVNYVFHVVEELLKRPEVDLTVLLADFNFSDQEIASFVRRSVRARLYEERAPATVSGFIRERTVDRSLAVRLPNQSEIDAAVAPGEIYHATDWYHYPSHRAHRNFLTYFDLTTKLFPNYHEHTNIVKERRKAENISRFDGIMAISQSTKRDLVTQYGADPSKIVVSYLGVSPVYERQVYEERSVFLSRYGIDPAHRYILSVSTIEPRKNTLGILESFRILCAEHPELNDVRLVLSGHMGWKNSDLQAYVETYPYRDRVVMAGYVDLQDMPSLYRHAEAFIYLSYYEGFGIPILEAMKCACPVVSSNTSSMPEVLGDCGELVSPHRPDEAAAALGRILDDVAYADTLRFSGHARSRAFTWRRHVDDLMQMYLT